MEDGEFNCTPWLSEAPALALNAPLHWSAAHVLHRYTLLYRYIKFTLGV